MGHICYLGKPQAADGAYYAGLGGIRMAGKKEALEAYVDACALVRETERYAKAVQARCGGRPCRPCPL